MNILLRLAKSVRLGITLGNRLFICSIGLGGVPRICGVTLICPCRIMTSGPLFTFNRQFTCTMFYRLTLTRGIMTSVVPITFRVSSVPCRRRGVSTQKILRKRLFILLRVTNRLFRRLERTSLGEGNEVLTGRIRKSRFGTSRRRLQIGKCGGCYAF